MEPKIKMGIGAVQNGLRAVTLGRKLLAVKRTLFGAGNRTAKNTVKKAEEQALRKEKRKMRREQGRRAIRRIKGIGRLAWVIRKRYF